MEGVSPTVIGPTGYGNDNSSQALGSGLLAGAALSNKGYGYRDTGLDVINGAQMGGICDLRHDVQEARVDIKDAEANIRRDVGEAECSLSKDVLTSSSDIRREVAQTAGDVKFQLHDNISQLGQNTNNRFALVDVGLVKAEMQSKLSAEQIIKEVNAETRHQAERAQDRLDAVDNRITDKFCAFERRVDGQFTALSHQIESCCCELKIANATATAKAAATTETTQTGLLNLILNALNTKNGN